MIPLREINAWRAHAPWPSDAQVEQDLLLTRAMVNIFSDPLLARQVAMRGGTALHKVHLSPAARYSEDIDLVLVGDASEPDVVAGLHRVMAPLKLRPADTPLARVGLRVRNAIRPSRIIRQTYAYQPTMRGQPEARLKIEVNCNEGKPVREIVSLDYRPPQLVSGIGEVRLRTYDINEMLGTKMRALYQRDQGRDLFDLWWALSWKDAQGRHTVDADETVATFADYMAREGASVDADAYDAALQTKLRNPAFVGDVAPLLRDGLEPRFEVARAVEVIRETIVAAMRRAESTPSP